MYFTTSLLAFSFGALALILPSGYSWGPAALLLCSIGAAIWQRSTKFILPRSEDKVIVISFILFFLVALFEVIIHGTAASELDKPSRFILALLVLALLNERPPSEPWVWFGFATGAIGASLVALYHVFGLGLPRADGGMNPIQFGNLSMLLGLISLCGIGCTLKERKNAFLFKIFLSAAFFAGILGSFLSGTRGGWPALAVIPPIVFIFYAKSVNTKKVLAGIFLACVASVVLMNIAGNSVERRINSAIAEMEAYQDNNNTRSSIGVRLELWKTAWLLGKSNPLTGWGTAGLQEGKQQLVEKELVSNNALKFSHAHNDYLDLFQKRGVLGLLSVVFLYLLPGLAFLQAVRKNDAGKPVALAGLVTTLSYSIFSLSQAFLEHNSGVMMYAFTIVILWGSYRQIASNKPASPDFS